MEKEYMVKLTRKQVNKLIEILDDELEYRWGGNLCYSRMRSMWDGIFHRMKADDDSFPLYAIKFDKEKNKHVVVEIPM